MLIIRIVCKFNELSLLKFKLIYLRYSSMTSNFSSTLDITYKQTPKIKTLINREIFFNQNLFYPVLKQFRSFNNQIKWVPTSDCELCDGTKRDGISNSLLFLSWELFCSFNFICFKVNISDLENKVNNNLTTMLNVYWFLSVYMCGVRRRTVTIHRQLRRDSSVFSLSCCCRLSSFISFHRQIFSSILQYGKWWAFGKKVYYQLW